MRNNTKCMPKLVDCDTAPFEPRVDRSAFLSTFVRLPTDTGLRRADIVNYRSSPPTLPPACTLSKLCMILMRLPTRNDVKSVQMPTLDHLILTGYFGRIAALVEPDKQRPRGLLR